MNSSFLKYKSLVLAPKTTFLFSLLIFLTFGEIYAQENSLTADPDHNLKKAIDLFDRDLYSSAQPLFKDYIDQMSYFDETEHLLSLQKAHYFYIVSAFNLDEPDAVMLAEDYIRKVSSTDLRQKMNYQIGHFYFKKQEFDEALPYFEDAISDELTTTEGDKARFELAYAYFNLQDFDKAYPLFNKAKEVHNEYYVPANYYAGFIALKNEDYDRALSAFKRVEKEDKYRLVVPYYIAEVYYHQQKYDQLLDYALPFLEEGDLYYNTDLKHLVGQTYFELKDYEKAIPYLEAYGKEADKLHKEDIYELAYSYYQTNQLEDAISGFKQLSSTTDSLGQNSMYLLGDCYLKTGQKEEARKAFAYSGKLDFNADQKEVSQFNYGKLSYELGYQDAALNALKSFISEYPQSQYNNEARELLANAFMNTSDYKNAFEVIQSLPKDNDEIRKAYQRVTFGRGMQLINDGALREADKLLDFALQSAVDQDLKLLTYFWKGEVALRSDQAQQAIPYFKDYLSENNGRTPPSLGEANEQTAQYDLGYSYLKTGQYRQAIGPFQKAQEIGGVNGVAIANDALLREADSYYMLTDYSKATSLYNQAISNGGAGSDYALYQKGIISGISGDNSQKVSILNQLSGQFPKSSYQKDANYQIGLTYLDEEKYREAIPYLKRIAEDKQNPNAVGALQKLGLAYFNLNENEEAEKTYKELIEDYSGTPEANDALRSLRNLYVNTGRPDSYVSYLRSLGRSVSSAMEDSITYSSGESLFAAGKFADAAKQFDNYLSQFPQGQNVTMAHFYRGESLYSNGEELKSLEDYEYVLTQGVSAITQHAALQASSINFYQKKDYQQALKDYQILKEVSNSKENTLKATRGILRSYYELEDWNEVKTSAEDLLEMEDVGTSDQLVANFYIGRASQMQKDYGDAIDHYELVAERTTSELGAEARYYIAESKFQQNNMKEAEDAAFEVVKKTPSYDVWVTKAYILLGNIFRKEKDYFNAKATLQSIIDNSKISELVNEAQTLLKQVEEEEAKDSKMIQDS